MPATDGVVRLQMKSKSSMPCTARGCRPLKHTVSRAPTISSRIPGSLLNKASCLVVEEHVFTTRAQWATGSSKTADIVVGRGAAA